RTGGAGQTRLPRKNEIAASTRNTTNRIQAMLLAAPAIPLKPSTAAIRAMTRKMTASLSMVVLQSVGALTAGDILAGHGTSGGDGSALRPGQTLEAFGNRHLGHIAEVAGGRRHVVPVRGAELLGREAGPPRLRTQAQQRPRGLADGADRISETEGERALDFGRTHRAQQRVDDLAHGHRLAVADEVGAAGAG